MSDTNERSTPMTRQQALRAAHLAYACRLDWGTWARARPIPATLEEWQAQYVAARESRRQREENSYMSFDELPSLHWAKFDAQRDEDVSWKVTTSGGGNSGLRSMCHVHLRVGYFHAHLGVTGRIGMSDMRYFTVGNIAEASRLLCAIRNADDVFEKDVSAEEAAASSQIEEIESHAPRQPWTQQDRDDEANAWRHFEAPPVAAGVHPALYRKGELELRQLTSGVEDLDGDAYFAWCGAVYQHYGANAEVHDFIGWLQDNAKARAMFEAAGAAYMRMPMNYKPCPTCKGEILYCHEQKCPTCDVLGVVPNPDLADADVHALLDRAADVREVDAVRLRSFEEALDLLTGGWSTYGMGGGRVVMSAHVREKLQESRLDELGVDVDDILRGFDQEDS